MSKQQIRLVQLYPRDMNIYGDWGNTLTLKKRLEWHGLEVDLIDYNPGDKFPNNVDLIVGGGGQDSGQYTIQNDLLSISDRLHGLASDGAPMLMVCGLYQLFGNFFRTLDGTTIQGIGIFDCETHASSQRLIGNTVTENETFGTIIGYENHSGLTYLGENAIAFGKLIQGAGNNGQDSTEGAVYKNVIGTYLHGALLPKNPQLADWLIEQAVTRKYGDFKPTVIDDQFATKARAIAIKRPR